MFIYFSTNNGFKLFQYLANQETGLIRNRTLEKFGVQQNKEYQELRLILNRTGCYLEIVGQENPKNIIKGINGGNSIVFYKEFTRGGGGMNWIQGA